MSTSARAQHNTFTLHLGADLVSRYVVPGQSFGTSPSIQPSLKAQWGSWDFGSWGNYSLNAADADNGAEHDFWLGYHMSLGQYGSAYMQLWDFYFPGNSDFFDFSTGGHGSHTLRAGLRYTLPQHSPAYLLIARHIYNEPDGSWYLEVGTSATVHETTVNLALGGATAHSGWYGVTGDRPALVHAEVGMRRELTISEAFALPLSARLVLNPHARQSYLIFGIHL